MLEGWSIVRLRMRLGHLPSGGAGVCWGRGGGLSAERGFRMGGDIEGELGAETGEFGELDMC
jgi:hypothetical protein